MGAIFCRTPGRTDDFAGGSPISKWNGREKRSSCWDIEHLFSEIKAGMKKCGEDWKDSGVRICRYVGS